MPTLKTPTQGNQELTKIGKTRRWYRNNPRRHQRMIDGLKKPKLENMPNLNAAEMFTGYGLAAAAGEIIKTLARHGIGAVRIKRVTVQGNAAMFEIHYFPALDKIPGTHQTKKWVGLEVNPICLLAWRKPRQERGDSHEN